MVESGPENNKLNSKDENEFLHGSAAETGFLILPSATLAIPCGGTPSVNRENTGACRRTGLVKWLTMRLKDGLVVVVDDSIESLKLFMLHRGSS